MLEYYRDGINAVDLGVIGECQYAVSFLSGAAVGIYRRPASYLNTYGGWRWECSSDHPARYPSIPLMAKLAKRVDIAMYAAEDCPANEF